MGRWRNCLGCAGTGNIAIRPFAIRPCPTCHGVGQLPLRDRLTPRERRLAADHPHDPPHPGCPACVAEDPIGALP